MRLYLVNVITSNGEETSRELKAESTQHAEKLASLKFDGARKITVVGSRDQTEAELAEEERLRAQATALPSQSETFKPVHVSRIRIGILLMVGGILGSAVSYFFAPGDSRPYYALAAATAAGAVFTLWGLTGASRSRSRHLQPQRRDPRPHLHRPPRPK